MEMNTIFLIIQVCLSLFFGFWVARKMRGMLRSLVLRMMPVDKRISNESFDIQTRKSAVFAFIIGLGIASLTFSGINWLGRKLKPHSKQEQTTITFNPLPVGSGSNVPENQEEEDDIQQEIPDEDPSLPNDGNDPPETENESFYFQVAAFQKETNAWNRKDALEPQFKGLVKVASHPNDYARYKVLIGPFNNPETARSFARKHRLKGFPRSTAPLRLYQ